MNSLLKAGMLWLGWEAGVGLRNIAERHTFYNEGREYCDEVGKPLLRIGMRTYPWEPPDADYTVDMDQRVENVLGGVLADERDMPFPNKYFGVCINQHTLEHLDSPEDVQEAVNECVRVADITVLLTPSPYSIISNVFNRRHRLRLHFDQVNNRIRVEENPGIGVSVVQARIAASMVIEDNSPAIFSRGKAIIIEPRVTV